VVPRVRTCASPRGLNLSLIANGGVRLVRLLFIPLDCRLRSRFSQNNKLGIAAKGSSCGDSGALGKLLCAIIGLAKVNCLAPPTISWASSHATRTADGHTPSFSPSLHTLKLSLQYPGNLTSVVHSFRVLQTHHIRFQPPLPRRSSFFRFPIIQDNHQNQNAFLRPHRIRPCCHGQRWHHHDHRHC
jgi:hypothetical protein